MSRIPLHSTPEQRSARALEQLRLAEEAMLRRALLALSQAQDAYLRAHAHLAGDASLKPPAPAHAPGLRTAEARLDAALLEAALWRDVVESS